MNATKEKIELVGGPQCGLIWTISSDDDLFNVPYNCLGQQFIAVYRNNNNGKARYVTG